jgi:hypothetical protein
MLYLIWLQECVIIKLRVGLRAKYSGLIIATKVNLFFFSVYKVFVGELKTALCKYPLKLFLCNLYRRSADRFI